MPCCKIETMPPAVGVNRKADTGATSWITPATAVGVAPHTGTWVVTGGVKLFGATESSGLMTDCSTVTPAGAKTLTLKTWQLLFSVTTLGVVPTRVRY